MPTGVRAEAFCGALPALPGRPDLLSLFTIISHSLTIWGIELRKHKGNQRRESGRKDLDQPPNGPESGM